MSSPEYFNLGCGGRFHPTWTNLDFVAGAPGVLAHDLRRGIPFPDEIGQMVYHSHVLEHFTPSDGNNFIRECFRVLKTGGILRVVVPDLECIARSYLAELDAALNCEMGAADHYDWIVLELFDQAVREVSGGEMAKYLRSDSPGRAYASKRLGLEARNIIEAHFPQNELPPPQPQHRFEPLRILRALWRCLRYPAVARRVLLQRLLTPDDQIALKIGRFRMSGEVHRWMYDRYSLKRLLCRAGFEGITTRSATDSYLPNWPSFHLDTEPDGTVYKPDSLYMEALKP